MRALRRNRSTFWYCLYQDVESVTDEYGNEIGNRVVYDDPVEMEANISPASGYSATEQFGDLDSYDKVIVTDWLDCPIDEQTVLFIDKEPDHNTSGELMYDYTVRRVAKSLNSISIAVRKVDVS